MQSAEALQNTCGLWLQQHSHTPQPPERGARRSELMMTVVATPPSRGEWELHSAGNGNVTTGTGMIKKSGQFHKRFRNILKSLSEEMMKPLLLVPTAWAQALERGSLLWAGCVTLSGVSQNFQRLLEMLSLWQYEVGSDDFPDRLGIASESYTGCKEMGDLWVPVVLPLCCLQVSPSKHRASQVTPYFP